jgi:hypothetical protein
MERSMIWIGRELRRKGLATRSEHLVYTLKRKRMMAGSFKQRGHFGAALLALLR